MALKTGHCVHGQFMSLQQLMGVKLPYHHDFFYVFSHFYTILSLDSYHCTLVHGCRMIRQDHLAVNSSHKLMVITTE